jgi:hypothetical protein
VKLPASLSGGLRLLGQGLSLALLRRPRSRVDVAGFGGFALSAVFVLACYAAQDYALTQKPAELYRDGFFIHASFALAVLAIAWGSSRLLLRPALWLNLADYTLLATLPLMLAWNQLGTWFPQADEIQLLAWKLLLAMAGFVVLLRVAGFVGAGSGVLRISGASLLALALLAWPWQQRQGAWLWYAIEQDEEEAAGTEVATATSDDPGFDAGAVADGQQALMEKALSAIAAQDPSRIDLYSLGFAGDGSESVFRNEVEYLSRLLPQRFGSQHRHLSLVNHPGSVADTPLASLSNLRAGLKGMAARMDLGQDLLFVYLTSHGSEGHQLKVGLEPIPMKQIDPDDLRRALDEAGIRWRVLVVSACYSGGFIERLQDPHTLVITAARADRTSFGCGADSEITWFGRAFLADALNQTSDLRLAYSLASKQVREWELEAGNTPSVPQMSEGAMIGAHLERWRAQFTPGAALPFAVATQVQVEKK